ncbi:Uncharacterized protein FWK35_00034319 [Aphis craccivora]|uniref:Uncharacterized protein n=1 Tax=Aphis craccivora TaxID=307492 RepID=A0A6G0VM69_APHCR|nr:Uncharacterized protein FWK35_00034319 [Aphis craccivora]
MFPSIVVAKSIFNIRPFNKKSVTVGFLVNKTISVIVMLECKVTKKLLTFNLLQWCTLMCDSNNYSSITNNLHTNCKRVKITDNIYYSVNLNQLTIKLHVKRMSVQLFFFVITCFRKIGFTPK